MIAHRNPLVHGLGLTLRHFPAVLWAFAFNLGYAVITIPGIAGVIGHAIDTSLAAQPLSRGFDLGTVAPLFAIKLAEGPGLTPASSASVLLFFATYFLLVPGTLLCYQTGVPARLSTLLQAGAMHFWRFVRITLLALLAFALILGPLGALQAKWSEFLDNHAVGRPAFLAEMLGILLLALVAAVLRLYFDLVEVYTVQLGLHLLPSGKPDRRVRKTLGPAWRALRRNFSRAYPTFLLLAILGTAAMVLTSTGVLHSLAKPSAVPLFLFAQIGLFLLLFTRFWQRAAETTLSLNHPIIEKPVLRTTFVPRQPAPFPTHIQHPPTHSPDPIPDPEPATPSLLQPDPAVFPQEPPIACPS